MNPFVHEYYVDLTRGTALERDRRALSQGDAYADKLIVHLQESGREVPLDGVGVSAKVIRYDNQTVPLVGTVENGAACVTLDEACYAVPGDLRVTLTLSVGEMIQSVLVVLLNVETSETSVIVDNGTIGTLTDLLAAVADMKAATEEAREASETANAAAVDNAEKTDAAIQTMQAKADDAIAGVNETLGNALEGVAEVLADAAPGIIIPMSGGLLTMADAAARPAQSLVSHIAPVQGGSGAPSPDNVRAISGWDAATLTRTGRNLVSHLDYVISNGNKATIITDDMIDVTDPTPYDYAYIPVRLKAGVTYTLHVQMEVYGRDESSTDPSYSKIGLIKSGDTVASHKCTANGVYNIINTYTSDTDTDGRVQLYVNYGNAPSAGSVPICACLRVMLVEGEYTLDTMPPFEPCTQQRLTAALPETVYGGTLDWTTGLLTVTHEVLQLDGTEVWDVKNGGTPNCYFFTPIGEHGRVINDSGICSHYPSKTIASTNTSIGVRVVNLAADDACIALRPDLSTISTVFDLQGYLTEQYAAGTPVTIVYQLTSPYTLQLDPQQLDLLKGYNALWSDTGDTNLTYVADTKLYIDNAIAALAANIINA